MPYFKDPAEKLHFLSDEDISNGWTSVIPIGSQQISDEDALAIEEAYAKNNEVQTPQEIDPVEKLRRFLAQNPDVEAIL